MAEKDEPKDWAPWAVALGSRVTQERERQGLSKEALAERSGLASRYIWRVEAGQQNIQLGSLARLARGLGIALSELMAGMEQLVENPVPRPQVKPRGKAAVRRRDLSAQRTD